MSGSVRAEQLRDSLRLQAAVRHLVKSDEGDAAGRRDCQPLVPRQFVLRSAISIRANVSECSNMRSADDIQGRRCISRNGTADFVANPPQSFRGDAPVLRRLVF